VRLGTGALVLGVLFAQIGTGPFVEGARLTSAWSLLVATAITAVSTLCCAWRWQLVASALGVRIDLRTAAMAVYRAQFLNATLPGGVLGDVHRAVGHGRDTGAVARSLRSVFWERTFGQVVQVAVTVAILVLLLAAVRTVGVVALVAGIAALVVICVLARVTRGRGVFARAARVVVADLEAVRTSTGPRGAIALASAASVACHLLVFLLAAHVAGVHATAYQVLPIAAVVLLAAAVPANIAGWGPREGVAAWAFAATGLGAATGVTTAVVYGVMALVATLPGAVVLVTGGRGRVDPVALARVPTQQEVARA